MTLVQHRDGRQRCTACQHVGYCTCVGEARRPGVVALKFEIGDRVKTPTGTGEIKAFSLSATGSEEGYSVAAEWWRADQLEAIE